eukprot:gnl/TRDRNA2_/TRDRNA2_136149_c1_seq1.p1 gnl/TRDRNA2_/TRDRNA2_136149_c1~~gnl/TRDRNA2_/TRDRNA2_136149_c1_seq1.p1  ORF type:complete len:335 (-),score=46.33 gnl/TRDRNA2_/TRDRNA2_136149_c1_seq1:85-1005(-)
MAGTVQLASSGGGSSYCVGGALFPSRRCYVQGSTAYFKQSSSLDSIGDVTTSFELSRLPPHTSVSVIAKQQMDTSNALGNANLVPWDTKKSGSMSVVNWVWVGSHTKDQMIEEKNSENGTMVVVLRIVGFLVMFLSLRLITYPLSVAPEILPCVGETISEIVGCALCCIDFSVAVAVSFTVIAVAWILARPAIGFGLLVVAALLFAAAWYVKSYYKKPGARTPRTYDPEAYPEAGNAMGTSARMASPLVSVAPAQQPGPTGQLMMAVCPQGTTPGQWVQVQGPDGRMYNVQVPAGVSPGQVFEYRV